MWVTLYAFDEAVRFQAFDCLPDCADAYTVLLGQHALVRQQVADHPLAIGDALQKHVPNLTVEWLWRQLTRGFG